MCHYVCLRTSCASKVLSYSFKNTKGVLVMKKIILVDDKDYILKVIHAALNRNLTEDVAIEMFTDPKDALEYIQEHGARLVISDVDMLPFSGIELMLRIQTHDEAIPVIIMSGHHGHERDALQLGAHTFIEKPPSINTLITHANEALLENPA